MTWDLSAERDYWRLKCADSFWWFFRYGWGYDFNPRGAAGNRPWLDDNTHKPACDWFEAHAKHWLTERKAGRGRQLKLMIVVPRDWGKTTLFTQAGQVWLHLHDPELATYTGAETMNRAREILNGIKSVISGQDRYSRFAWLYGNWRSRDRTWKIDQAVSAVRTNLTRRDASFGSWAVEQGMVGLHPDGCFFDDPNTYEKISTHAEWLTLVNQHLDTLIPVFQPDAIWVLTATRYGVDDHIGRSLRLEGVKSVSGMDMPSTRISEDGLWHVYYLDAIDKNDNLVMPKIWDWPRLNNFKRRNPLRYWSQVRNNPAQAPTNSLTVDQCENLICGPDAFDVKKLRITIHLDTAFKLTTRKARGDRNVMTVCGHHTDGTGRVVYLDARWSEDWGSDEFTTNLIEIVKKWKDQGQRFACITDESEPQGKPGLWRAHLENSFKLAEIQPMPHFIQISRSHIGKENRLSEAAALWRAGRMMLYKNAPGLDILIMEMTGIGMGGRDDFADATSDCFNRECYRAVIGYVTTDDKGKPKDPFDYILKPGPLSMEAAVKWADHVHKEEQNFANVKFDVVRP